MEYKAIKRMLLDGRVSAPEVFLIALDDLNEYQITIIVSLLFQRLSEAKNEQMKQLLENYERISSYLLRLFHHDDYYNSIPICECIDEKLIELLLRIYLKRSIGIDMFKYAMSHIMSPDADAVFIGLFLIGIYMNELSQDDMNNLALAMRDTGKIYDYRGRFHGKKIVRRYPTGAVSEKTALILPSMIALSHDEYPIVSSFLVAKSLSFTGGTWDKLSSIPGFNFPLPGDETCTAIEHCGVAMTVAQADLCPVDTILYQLRSITDTVDSISLAVTSIASKQLSCPPDFLLLDVRFGTGAFFNKENAIALCSGIERILKNNGIIVLSRFTDTNQPNGSSIGNQLEICEAISIMCDTDDSFDARGKAEQANIVSSFYTTIMENIMPNTTEIEWYNRARSMFSQHKLKQSFLSILREHGIPKCDAEELLDNPIRFFDLKPSISIKAEVCGRLTQIDQKKLGDIVNLGCSDGIRVDLNKPVQDILSYGSQPFMQKINVLLCKRLGDEIEIGDTLCQIFLVNDYNFTDDQKSRTIKQIVSCFEIL